MNSKSTTIRVFGQRSIASSFGSLPSSSSADSKQVVGKEVSKKGTPVSLSDFLDRKLQKNAVPPRKVLQGKSTPFSSPLCSSVSAGGHVLPKRKDEGEATSVSKVIFEQFKHADSGKREFILPCNAGEVESCTNNYLESRKRRNHFEATGGNDNHNVGNHVVVLGGDSKPNQKRRNDSFIKFKKPRHLYNHYANGCGWWDCDMEGVDNEEVGFSEVWEGVGSTSLGGIEWH